MTIANYIARAKGIFDFIRFDQAKPGNLEKLGPITNGTIGGLIACLIKHVFTSHKSSTRTADMTKKSLTLKFL